MDRIRCGAIILVILGIGFLIGGVLLITLGDSIIKKAVKKECQLKKGTVVYNLWRDSPVPLYISIYVFDLNDTDFLNGSVKPRVRQRGPFVYKEDRKKTNVEEFPDETILYQEPRTYTFDPIRSAENETANITTINIVYMTLVNFLQMEQAPSIFRRMVGELLAVQEKPLMYRTVKEYLWGYQDPLLQMLKRDFPDIVTSDQVSAFNTSVSGAGLNTFVINNGAGFDANHVERVNNLGKIERFNDEPTLPYWTNEYANMINGTDSTLWHPDASKTERVYAYIPDICRSIYLEFNDTRANKFNIDTYHYTFPNTVFSNSPENVGFCLNSTAVNKTHELECLPSGLFSLKTCIHLSGSSVSIPLPIIASMPHFLTADPSVQNAVLGLAPDDIKHRSYVDIEPITGIVMNGSRRAQININVVNDSNINAISHLNPFVYPMLWVDEHAEIDKHGADTFHKKVTTQITTLNVVKYGLIGIGGVLFVTVLGLLAYRRHKTNISGPAFAPPAADERSPLLF